MDVVMNENRLSRWLPFRLRGALAGAILATGMSALAAPPQQRAAILLPPVKMEPGELPTLARGAIDDLPGTAIGSTPVARKKANGAAPGWISGVDPNIVPAAGLATARDKTESKAPFFGNTKGIPPLTPGKANTTASIPPSPPQPRLLDKAKLAPPPLTGNPEPAGDPSMPFRGVASNGAPVMAGPPAYRWYGYGTVTPGANQFAPNGQYPKASANWYGVTGATPGAFPVPVVNPYRGTPGNEPPSYVGVPPTRSMELPKATAVVPPVHAGVRPSPGMNTGTPTMPPIGTIGTGGSLPPLPAPVGVPTMPISAPAKPTMKLSKPGPEPLPPSLDSSWSPGMPTPVLPPPNLFSEPGAKLIQQELVARAQMPEPGKTDSIIASIHGVIRDRATGIDVRYNSTRKLTVCFEVKSTTDATRLVKDISARPELAPFAIDFCVLVK